MSRRPRCRPNKRLISAASGLLLLITRTARAHSEFDDDPPPPEPRYDVLTEPHLAVDLSIAGGPTGVKDAAQIRGGVGDGVGGFIATRFAFLRYLYVETGIGDISLPDRNKFSETTCLIGGGNCGAASSKVHGLTLSFETGILFRLFLPIASNAIAFAFVGGAGHRGVYLHRSVDYGSGVSCDNCRSDYVGIDGGFYLTPELDMSFTVFGDPGKETALLGLRAKDEFYLTGDLVYAASFGVFLEALW